jgi:hypothetical protein
VGQTDIRKLLIVGAMNRMFFEPHAGPVAQATIRGPTRDR